MRGLCINRCGEVSVRVRGRKAKATVTCVLSALGFFLRNVIPEGMVAPGGQRERCGVVSPGVGQDAAGLKK